MRLESKNTVNPRDGLARHWALGPISIEWFVERPPQDLLRFDGNISVRWYAEEP